MIKSNIYSDEMLKWIEKNQKGISRAELTSRFNKRFNSDFNINQLSSLCRRCGWRNGVNAGQLEKGGTPWNKGRKGLTNGAAYKGFFKKGHGGFKTRPVGSERMCSKDGYVMVKTKAPRTWERKHLVEWRKHHGEIPRDCCIRFLDNDRTNCHISNLVCIHRGANAVINHCNPADSDNPDINHAIILTEQVNYIVKNIDKMRSTA